MRTSRFGEGRVNEDMNPGEANFRPLFHGFAKLTVTE